MPMSVRRIRQMAGIVCVVLAVAICAILLFSITAPFTLPSTSVTQAVHRVQVKVSNTPDITLTDFRRSWSLKLQRPLYDPPKKEKKKAVFHSPPLHLTLTGIVHEPGHTQAILMDASGNLSFDRVGQRVHKATVINVGKDQVQLRYYGHLVTLKLPEK